MSGLTLNEIDKQKGKAIAFLKKTGQGNQASLIVMECRNTWPK